MAKYLKLFNEHSEYKSFIQTEDFIRPNVSYCIEENEVHYNPIWVPNANGHAYIDLGLPSGTLWATMNVGANTETDYGLYFAWGETEGYTASQVGSGEGKKYFGWSDYKYANGASNKLTKYCGDSSYGNEGFTDTLTTLELSDDAAYVNWGGDWRMPTGEMFKELTANTTVIGTTVSGVSGVTFTAANGNSLFIPSAGICYGGRVNGPGSGGACWSSSVTSGNEAIYLRCQNEYQDVVPNSRCSGQSVRPVIVPN